MGNIVEDEKITHDLFVKRLAFQMATIKEIEYVDKNGAAQILKRPTKVTMTVSMASPAAGTTGINFDRPLSPELMTYDNMAHVPTDADSKKRCEWCKLVHDNNYHASKEKCTACATHFCSRRLTGRDCFALHAKYGLPPHRMTSKAINDIKKFSAADRAKWLEIKRNDSNASTKCKGAVVGFTAMKKKRKRGGD